jgi:glycosyltransferase involved in cell wall biosynthesis
MGLVTSIFEGWPVYVMEAICAGRPVISLQLEQMADTFADSECGVMLDVNNTDESTIDMMAETILTTWEKIQTAQIEPESVNRKMDPFKASTQLVRLFDLHKEAK